MFHGEYIGRCDGEGEIYFRDHIQFRKFKGWLKKGKIRNGKLKFEKLPGNQNERITVEG